MQVGVGALALWRFPGGTTLCCFGFWKQICGTIPKGANESVFAFSSLLSLSYQLPVRRRRASQYRNIG